MRRRLSKGGAVIRCALPTAIVIALVTTPAVAGAASGPFVNDPMGALHDVSSRWRHFQAAIRFCIKPDVTEYTPGGAGATLTGRNRVCRRSGFPRRAKHLVKIHVRAPSLCGGCRRFFIDFSRIPRTSPAGDGHAQGHAYYHLASFNNTYTVRPTAHSPNTKNFTNDKLLAPDGSPQEQVIGGWDLHAIEYVTDTRHFIHNSSQGPYYVGPWYLNRGGRRIHGVYLDVNVAGAMRLPDPTLNGIGYIAGFNSGGACPSDDDLLYAGCFDWWGMSSTTIDPFAG
jgi:hypothetical protein